MLLLVSGRSAANRCCNITWTSVHLVQNYMHDIIVDYREIRGSAYVQLAWASLSVPYQIIPASNLFYPTQIDGSPFLNVSILPGDPADPVKSTASGGAMTSASGMSGQP